ncbi:hypothetical protein [Actinomadura rudentiformis]|uniref:Uncharacterized protein n=1 Tax=Actinomadura rudentiformis TaxID=359158 RepID=A0A6H9Z3Z4_9ACTN|nr:hypothetical protein [Actinomadura rudentiformis]KAB2349521.1 hypothetical protein F8566_12125 [Actinomadura rudentiformis]
MRGRNGEHEPTPEHEPALENGPAPEHEPTPGSFDRWRDLLRSESERHDPSEEVMWARVESAMAEPHGGSARRRRRVALRVAAAAVATAAVIGSAVAMRLTGPDRTPVVPVAEGTGTPRTKPSSPGAATPTEGGSPKPGPGGTTTSSSSSPASSPTSKSTRTPVNSDGAVAATASLDPNSSAYWAQHNIVLNVRQPLDRLAVTIRIARTGKVSPTGSWLTLPASDFEISTGNAGDDVVYRWTLRAGRSVPVGSHTLAAQYNRGAGHDPRKDTFTVTATAGEKQATLSGHF